MPILLVFVTYVYHDARLKECKVCFSLILRLKITFSCMNVSTITTYILPIHIQVRTYVTRVHFSFHKFIVLVSYRRSRVLASIVSLNPIITLNFCFLVPFNLLQNEVLLRVSLE